MVSGEQAVLIAHRFSHICPTGVWREDRVSVARRQFAETDCWAIGTEEPLAPGELDWERLFPNYDYTYFISVADGHLVGVQQGRAIMILSSPISPDGFWPKPVPRNRYL